MGLGLIILLGWLVPYVTFIVKTGVVSMGGAFAWGQVPTAPFLVLVVLARIFGPAVNKLLRRRGYGVNDALMSYAMVLSTLTLCTQGMLWYVPSIAAVPFYAQGGHAPWVKLILPHLPSWMLVGGEPGQERLVRYLFEGTPSGAPIVPWNMWLGPMAAWLGMLTMLYFTAVCVTGMFRRRWFEQEHITFPFAELALAVGGGPSAWDTARGIFREKLMWLGFSIPFIHCALIALAFLVKGFPDLGFKDIQLGHIFTGAPWNIVQGHIMFRFQWLVLGIAYLIPAQISIGTVFFYFASLLQMVVFASLGATGGEWYPHTFIVRQSTGGLLIFAFFLFYAARLDIRQMWQDLWGDISGRPSANPHPDRWLLLGAVAGTAGLIAWSHAAGLDWWVAIVFIGLVILFQLCVSRIVAVLGMQHATMWISPTGLLEAAVGTKGLGPANIPSINLQERVIWYAEQSTFFPMVLQSHKIGNVLRWKSGNYISGLLAAGVVGLVAYSFFYIRMAYQYGGLMMSPKWYFMYIDVQIYNQIAGKMANIAGAPLAGRVGVLFGLLAMWILMSCHRAFPWWPFHPLGFLLASGYTARVTWPGLLTGWAVKTAVSRYGGERMYFTLRPIFLGLLIGDVGGQAFWAVVCAVAKGLGWVT